MQRLLMLGSVAALLHGAAAQSGAYGQCGGTGWTGSTTCVAGYVCTFQNEWYSQCVPGTATTTTKPTTSTTTSKPTSTSSKTKTTLVTSTQTSATGTAAPSCTGTFKSISAADYIAALNPGWNLGNTLDAPEYEGAWNNPPVVPATFDDIKASKFNSVRLPVTWHYHVTGGSPDWTINSTWLQRVSDVLDMITSRGMYAIVNVHHDSWIWADVTQSGANITMIEEKFYRLWSQIGAKLACKSELVAFEPINEPPGTTAEHGAQINKFNELFLKAINEAGGFNPKRVVTLVGAGEDGLKTTQWFKMPTGYPNPIAIQYHYYSPYDFIFSAWGKTIWGSDADKATLDSDLAIVRGNFSDVPLVIGEWDAAASQTETAARWKYFDYFLRTAKKYNTATVIWDNGEDQFNRNTHTWRDPTALDILLNASKGTTNSLADSTEDGSATSQQSSAYIYHKVGDAVTAQTLPFLFNGNTLKSITSGSKTLTANTDYSVSGNNIVFTSSYLATVVSQTASAGVKANLTLAFSAGASLQVQVVQWDVPTISSTSSAANSGSDLSIPITWKGLNKVAAVKALRSDNVYLVDDWTQYLGPLQQARTTFNSQFKWDTSNIILTSAASQAVVSAGKSTVFTFEFYPRVPGNSVNYTLTV